MLFPEVLSPQRIKDDDWATIYSVPEVICTEKADGSSWRMLVGYNETGELIMQFGSHHVVLNLEDIKVQKSSSIHRWFANSILEDVARCQTLRNYAQFLLGGVPNSFFAIYAEAYGSGKEMGTIQSTGKKYAQDYFLAIFDVLIWKQEEGKFLDWDALDDFCHAISLPLVPIMYRGKPDKEIFKSLLTAHSYLAESHKMPELKPIEGIVIKSNPPQKIAPGKDWTNQWYTFKLKNAEFEEVRPKKEPREHADWGPAEIFAEQVVTRERIHHVIAQLTEQGNIIEHSLRDLSIIPKAMIADIVKEEKALYETCLSDIITEHIINKCLNKYTIQLYKTMIQPQL